MIDGLPGLLFWLAFFALFASCAITTRRHDRKAELDGYAAVRAYVSRRWADDWDSEEDADYDRMTGAPW